MICSIFLEGVAFGRIAEAELKDLIKCSRPIGSGIRKRNGLKFVRKIYPGSSPKVEYSVAREDGIRSNF